MTPTEPSPKIDADYLMIVQEIEEDITPISDLGPFLLIAYLRENLSEKPLQVAESVQEKAQVVISLITKLFENNSIQEMFSATITSLGSREGSFLLSPKKLSLLYDQLNEPVKPSK